MWINTISHTYELFHIEQLVWISFYLPPDFHQTSYCGFTFVHTTLYPKATNSYSQDANTLQANSSISGIINWRIVDSRIILKCFRAIIVVYCEIAYFESLLSGKNLQMQSAKMLINHYCRPKASVCGESSHYWQSSFCNDKWNIWWIKWILTSFAYILNDIVHHLDIITMLAKQIIK